MQLREEDLGIVSVGDRSPGAANAACSDSTVRGARHDAQAKENANHGPFITSTSDEATPDGGGGGRCTFDSSLDQAAVTAPPASWASSGQPPAEWEETPTSTTMNRCGLYQTGSGAGAARHWRRSRSTRSSETRSFPRRGGSNMTGLWPEAIRRQPSTRRGEILSSPRDTTISRRVTAAYPVRPPEGASRRWRPRPRMNQDAHRECLLSPQPRCARRRSGARSGAARGYRSDRRAHHAASVAAAHHASARTHLTSHGTGAWSFAAWSGISSASTIPGSPSTAPATIAAPERLTFTR